MNWIRKGNLKQLAFAFISILLGLIAPLIIAELTFRALPTSDALKVEPVTLTDQYQHFAPNRVLTLSRGAFFSTVAKKHVNNSGFLSDLNYSRSGKKTFIVIGDSYVEAVQVANRDSIHGLLNSMAGPGREVYGIGTSGSPLSQYLAYARFAIRNFSSAGICIVVVGNDFDESLLEYKNSPGFFYFKETTKGLESVLVEYHPSIFKKLFRESALIRYLYLNRAISIDSLVPFSIRKMQKEYVGNVALVVDKTRVEKSKQAVDFFLSELFRSVNGLPVVLAVDAPRPVIYEAKGSGGDDRSYFEEMRNYFMVQAVKYNFEVADLNQVFFDDFHKNKINLEFPDDGHWNSRAHRLAANAVSKSNVFQGFIGRH